VSILAAYGQARLDSDTASVAGPARGGPKARSGRGRPTIDEGCELIHAEGYESVRQVTLCVDIRWLRAVGCRSLRGVRIVRPQFEGQHPGGHGVPPQAEPRDRSATLSVQ